MRYLLFSFIIFCIGFAFSFIASVIKKRFAFVSLVLTYAGIMLSLMYKFDIKYLKDLIGDITNFLLYLFIGSIVCFIVSIVEGIFMKNKRRKQNTYKASEKVFIEKDTKLYYMNLILEDVAYYNNDKKCFILNNSFRRRLDFPSIEASIDEIATYLYEEDKNAFSSLKDKTKFRLNTISGASWYEYREELIGDEKYILIHKVEDKLGSLSTVGNYKELNKILSDYEAKRENFSIVLINIYAIREVLQRNFPNLATLKDVREKDLREIIVIKYLTAILNGDLKEMVTIYKIGGSEYAFVIKGKEAYGVVERALINNQSVFLSDNIKIEDKTYNVRSKVALVNSKYVEISDNYHVINAAFDTLQVLIASSKKEDYQIYQATGDDENNFDLKDMGIDLDNDIKQFYKKNDE